MVLYGQNPHYTKKEKSQDPGVYRTITYMSNLYKLDTKVVTHEMKDNVELNKILSEN